VAAFALAKRLRGGETVFGAWSNLGSPIVAETVARAGFASVSLDAQHGLWDFGAMVSAIGAIIQAGASPGVRVPLNDYASVSRALDMGAEVVIAPMINNAADARRFAASAKYPPLGERSWGPTRAMSLQDKTVAVDYLREANDGTLTLAMIDRRGARRRRRHRGNARHRCAVHRTLRSVDHIERRQGAGHHGAGGRARRRCDLRRRQ
jgi:4-hydroxy-2-oxoheptanedioate aldolase